MGRQRTVDLVGKKYNFLDVISRHETDVRKWICRCDCGKVIATTKQRLENGRSKSCGCMKSELLSKAFTLHGASGKGENNPTYQSYVAMLHRCYDDKRRGWERYGGRGIIVEEESWLLASPEGYENFIKDMGVRPDNTSLDRIDPDGNYCKNNCRWSGSRIQGYNKYFTKTSDNTSKHRGVSLRKSNGKWMARIGNGKGGYEYLGDFVTEELAALAYNKRAVEIHGSDAILNDINIPCAIDIVDAGIVEFIYRDNYRSDKGLQHLMSCGIVVRQINEKE